jgi:hypothetical protein
MTASERTDPMNSEQRPGRQATDAGGGGDSRALDRYENEGGPGPEDTRDQRPDDPTEDGDAVDPGRVVVTPGSTADAFQVHHRDIPELHADGASPREAAANLAQDLDREIESVADDFRRGLLVRVLADVRAFTAQSP